MASGTHHETSHLPELAALVLQNTDVTRESRFFATAIEGVSLLRSDSVEQPCQCIIKPALCITLAGAKTATFGNKLYEYRAGYGLVVTVEMPERGTVCAANETNPYLGIVLELDQRVLQELVEERSAELGTRVKVKSAGAFTLKLNNQLIDCALRTMKLLTTPEAIPALYPGIMLEICYWLLRGPGGDQLHRIMVMANGQDRGVLRAIRQLRDRYREPVLVEELAHVAHMSLTTFHRQFKMITSMAPLQYQKQLRLLEARRLLISDDVTVESAAFQVGYASVSQFSREYVRTFGSSPRREVSGWRSASSRAVPAD